MEGKGEEEAEAATPAFTRSGSAGVDKFPRAPKTRTLPHTETRLFVEGKVVVVGDMSVGKTCVVARFTKDVAFSQKKVATDNITCKFCIWDTLGQEKFRSINTLYYRSSAAAVVVYDITSKASFDAIPYWVEQVLKFAAKGCIIAIAGNKCDAEAKREVPRADAEGYATRNGFMFAEVSAKTGDHIMGLFQDIAREARNHLGGEEEGFRILEVDRTRLLDVGDDKPAASTCSC